MGCIPYLEGGTALPLVVLSSKPLLLVWYSSENSVAALLDYGPGCGSMRGTAELD